MGFTRLVLAASAALFVLIWPAASAADHVSIEASVGAFLKERIGPEAWVVEIGWSAQCKGVGPAGASYSGNLNLVDEQSGERIYVGGVASAAGTVRQVVKAKSYWRRMRPELKILCGDRGGTLHGAGPIEVVGGEAIGVAQIPPLDGDGGGGGGSGGTGGSGGSSPTEPLGAGGCLRALVGTDGPDTLTGSAAGDVIFGRGGNDEADGRGSHDCLIGAAGSDTLRGGSGADRLTGGSGRDRLSGGAGNDTIQARGGDKDAVDCGAGRDLVFADRKDVVAANCENVRRA